jgi:G3E family GTPase
MKLVLVGGFLGSGKTTAIVNACLQLIKSKKRVAVVTNDQGDQQVDSAYVKSFGIAAREVSNGCFCCNYEQLDAHLESFIENDYPDYIFAESVGSCTDLVATIAKPLSKLKPKVGVVITVFADAELLCALTENRISFLDESVRYIYKKQLEETDLLIINKTDLITGEQLTTLSDIIKTEFSGKIILHQNSLEEDSISKWLSNVNQFAGTSKRASLDIDYDRYSQGEAKLAWLDKNLIITSTHGDATLIARQIIRSIFDQIQVARLPIGHLKFFLEGDHWREKVSFTTTSTSADMELNNHGSGQVKVLINARVKTNPDVLRNLVDEVVNNAERTYRCRIQREKWSAFTPGYPRPTHRIAE